MDPGHDKNRIENEIAKSILNLLYKSDNKINISITNFYEMANRGAKHSMSTILDKSVDLLINSNKFKSTDSLSKIIILDRFDEKFGSLSNNGFVIDSLTTKILFNDKFKLEIRSGMENADNLHKYLNDIITKTRKINNVKFREIIKDYISDISKDVMTIIKQRNGMTFKNPDRQSRLKDLVDYIKDDTITGDKTRRGFFEYIGKPNAGEGNLARFFAAAIKSGIVSLDSSRKPPIFKLGPNYDNWINKKLLAI